LVISVWNCRSEGTVAWIVVVHSAVTGNGHFGAFRSVNIVCIFQKRQFNLLVPYSIQIVSMLRRKNSTQRKV